ncbi:Fanconi anemia group G protein isoform X2 [Denticeps clupeoides]|uniref:Uncharacterized protein n=1 Tax=Denticeps clupeoides TaxID=299321 RepID=A0AAY4B6S3_9TELE|nr:Fanconi anemia group G protein isoform X2 [Denticeps clupeoides]
MADRAGGGLLRGWVDESNAIVTAWQECESRGESEHSARTQFYEKSCKLLQKMHGVPPVSSQVELEMTLVYNTFLFSLTCPQHFDVQENLSRTLIRALEALGSQALTSDLVALWRLVLKTLSDAGFLACVHKLLCVQWALWLSSGHLQNIHCLLLIVTQGETRTPSDDLMTVIRNLGLSSDEKSSLLVAVATSVLKDLLHICTVVAQGIERLRQGSHAEALQAFLHATCLPAPRRLFAQVHTLAGLTFAKLDQPYSALQCNRKALEVDFGCLSALYQSSLIYRGLKKTEAEIEALQLLYSATTLRSNVPPASAVVPLISSDMLLSCKYFKSIITAPSSLHILYSLAHACALHNRFSEAVEHYLDLLALLQSDFMQTVCTEGNVAVFPRIPAVYLEAAFTMLSAKKFWDAAAVCEEVISKTADLIPEKLVLVPLAEEDFPAPAVPSILESTESRRLDRLDCVLWAGASYCLQGHAYYQMKETNESVTIYSRCLNLLAKVSLKRLAIAGQPVGEKDPPKFETLQRLRGLVLAGRGMCFMDQGQWKEALRDLKLSLQTSPGLQNAQYALTEVYWRLGRKEEAITCWKESVIMPVETPSAGDFPLYLQGFSEDSLSFDLNDLRKRMGEVCQTSGLSA